MRCAPFCNNNSAISKLLCIHARVRGDQLNCGDETLNKTKRKEISKFLKKKKKENTNKLL